MNDACEIISAIKNRILTCEEVVEHYLHRAEQLNPKLNAVITFNERAREQARDRDRRLQQGQSMGRLAGLPLFLKDNICTQGLKTTAGSKMLAEFVPPYSATLCQRLVTEGAVILGKTNLDEFSMGSSNETSFFGPCRNPWNTDYVPGGSSGGSAAAVAAGMALAAIGTDTGGSIRQPAHFCGVVGVKPTYGRISRYGLIAFASSMDQAGPMVRTVRDGALLLEAMCGQDPFDATTARESVPPFSQLLQPQLKGVKIGVPVDDVDKTDWHPDIKARFDEVLKALKDAGAELIHINLPYPDLWVPVYYLLAASEASSNLSRYDGVRYGYRADFHERPAEDLEDFYCRTRGEAFGTEVKRRILLGTYSLSAGYVEEWYFKASQLRRKIRDAMIEVFKSCQAFITPVSVTPAFKLDEKIKDPLRMYENDQLTVLANLAGLPSLSLPVGFSQEGLPIGLQLTTSYFCEQTLLNVAAGLEALCAPLVQKRASLFNEDLQLKRGVRGG